MDVEILVCVLADARMRLRGGLDRRHRMGGRVGPLRRRWGDGFGKGVYRGRR